MYSASRRTPIAHLGGAARLCFAPTSRALTGFAPSGSSECIRILSVVRGLVYYIYIYMYITYNRYFRILSGVQSFEIQASPLGDWTSSWPAQSEARAVRGAAGQGVRAVAALQIVPPRIVQTMFKIRSNNKNEIIK